MDKGFSSTREVPSDALDCWKAIADYLHHDVRTVMRWERTRHLPVYRLPGSGKAAVFAIQSELDRWRKSSLIHAIAPHEMAEAPTIATVPSVAVLPFANLSGDEENQYFGDGLADEIITTLAREPGLRVTARTSSFIFRQKELDLRAIGARLGVGAVLAGSVQRTGDRIRVSAQLGGAVDGYQLWGKCYDRKLTDVFVVQEEIARCIADALKVRLGARAAKPPKRTASMDAYCLWLKGRQCQYNRRCAADYVREGEYFAEACRLDPDWAPAHLALAEHLRDAAVLAMLPPRQVAAEGREAVDRALALEESLGEAFAVRGTFRALFDYDWSAAEDDFERALELEPGSPAVHCSHAMYVLVPTLQLDRAEAELDRTLELDPLSPESHVFMGMLLYFRRDYDRAEASLRNAIELGDGAYAMAEWLLGMLALARNHLQQAISTCESAMKRFGPIPGVVAALGTVYGWGGRATEARQSLLQLERAAERIFVGPLCRAWVHMGLGETDEAFYWLDRAIEEHDPQVIHLSAKPIYDGLRQDARFPELLRKMRLQPRYAGVPRA